MSEISVHLVQYYMEIGKKEYSDPFSNPQLSDEGHSMDPLSDKRQRFGQRAMMCDVDTLRSASTPQI